MKKIIFVLIFTAISNYSHAAICDSKIVAILTGAQYCGGESVGFLLEGADKYLCSGSQSMNSMIIAAFMAKTPVSVRDSNWENCSSYTQTSVPNHIWFGELP